MAKKKTYVLGSRRKRQLELLDIGYRLNDAYNNMTSANPRPSASGAIDNYRKVELEWVKANKYPERPWVAQEKILAAQAKRRAAEDARRLAEYQKDRNSPKRARIRKKSLVWTWKVNKKFWEGLG